MDGIEKGDLEHMDLEPPMPEEEEEEENESSEEEEEEEEMQSSSKAKIAQEVFIPGKHSLKDGEELVRDERYDNNLRFVSS